MTPEEMRQKAIDLFQKRFHCSQAVLAVGQEKLGIRNEEVIKAMGLFGGGFAGCTYTCGALSGAIALISSLYSRGNLEEKDNPRMWALGRKMVKKFEELTQAHGSINCRDIARVDWTDSQAAKEFYSSPESRRGLCIQLVGDTAYALGVFLEEQEEAK